MLRVNLKRKIIVRATRYDGSHYDVAANALMGIGAEVGNAEFLSLVVKKAFTVTSERISEHFVGEPLTRYEEFASTIATNIFGPEERDKFTSSDNWIGTLIEIPKNNIDAVETVMAERTSGN